MKLFKYQLHEVAIVGDQLFTDIYGGNRVGIKTVLVNPMSKDDAFGTKFFRYLENRKFRINIPGNLTEEQIKDLREFIKKIGAERPNTDVEIVNKDKTKTLKLFINDNVIEELEARIGRTNIDWIA